MTFAIGLLLVIILISVVLFAIEVVPADVIALGLLAVLILTKLIPYDQAFSGFGSDTVIMILGLLIMTAALLKTGVMDLVGRNALRFIGKNPNVLLLVVMGTVGTVSAFMSNTAATAFFVPVVLGLAGRAKVSPTKLLLPLAFSSILSSSVTLISTSTNIVVSGLMTRAHMAPLGMFEMAPVGITIALAGMAYMFFIGRRLLPDRTEATDGTLALNINSYLTEILILPTSDLVGKTLEAAGLGRDLDLTVVRIIREKTKHLAPHPDSVLAAEDILLVEGAREDVLRIKEVSGIEIKADVKLTDPALNKEDLNIVEILVLPKSSLVGRTLKQFRFRERYGLQVLGINRSGKSVQRKMSLVRMQVGDVLLVQGAINNIVSLEEAYHFRVLGQMTAAKTNSSKAPLAVTIFLGAIALATFHVMGFALAVIIGSVAMFVTKCITPEEAYREVEWKAIILIGSMLGLGVAMEHTGAASYLASLIVQGVGNAKPLWLLAGFFVLTVGLTQPMSNQAAAVVVVPIAIQMATQLHLNPRAFVMMIAIAASCSYLTPLEPSCLIVYGPGRYKFMDFLKIGTPLTIIVGAIALFMVPRIWPLH